MPNFSLLTLLNTHRVPLILDLVAHPHHHQRPPLDALSDLLNSFRLLSDHLVIFSELVGGDLQGALFCVTNLLLRFQLRLEIRL